MAGDLDKHAREDEHDGGKNHSTLLETEGHGQDAHAYNGVGQCYGGSDGHGGAERGG